MTALEKAMEAARNVTELFGRDEEVARAALMAVRELGPEWFATQEAFGLRPEDAVGSRYFIDAILNEEPK